MIQTLNPATGETLRSFEPLTPAALDARIDLAADAARTYPSIRLDERAFWLRRLALLLESDAHELAVLITTEMGKTLVSAHAEIAKCASVCRFYADNAATFLAPEPVTIDSGEAHIHYHPMGVILAIMPWNYPFWQVFRGLAPMLMAGNVVLLKHAPNVPQCALAIEALVRRAGFPRGAFQSLLLEDEQVESVIAHPTVVAVTLTGSERAGQAVASQAGWYLKKSVLELGGSDPFLVMPTAELEHAVRAAVQSRCLANGQTCIAAKRFLVHTSVYEAFQTHFVAAMYALRVGDPTHPDTDLGPLATAAIREHLLHQIEAAKASGGIVLCGGHSLPGSGFFMQPTVIAGVDPASAIAKEEFFGPVALIFRISSLDEAITLANDTPFGLGASAWTLDPDEQRRLTMELESGCVFFNAPVASDWRLPFGGVKHSGYGRELGQAGIREFVNVRTVVIAETPSQRAAMQPTLFEAAPPVPLPTPLWTPQPFVVPALSDLAASPRSGPATVATTAAQPINSPREAVEPDPIQQAAEGRSRQHQPLAASSEQQQTPEPPQTAAPTRRTTWEPRPPRPLPLESFTTDPTPTERPRASGYTTLGLSSLNVRPLQSESRAPQAESRPESQTESRPEPRASAPLPPAQTEFRLPPLPSGEGVYRLRPLPTGDGEFRLPPLPFDTDQPPLNPNAVQLKPVDTTYANTHPEYSYNDDEYDTKPRRDTSIFHLGRRD